MTDTLETLLTVGRIFFWAGAMYGALFMMSDPQEKLGWRVTGAGAAILSLYCLHETIIAALTRYPL